MANIPLSKNKILSKYLNPLKKKQQNQHSNSEHLLVRDEDHVQQIPSSLSQSESESSQPRQRRVYSDDEQGGESKPKLKKKKNKGDKAERKVKKKLRKMLKIDKDEDIDEFVTNLNIEGISHKEILQNLKSNSLVLELNTKEKKAKKKKEKKEKQKEIEDKFKMFQKSESSDMQIPQAARTVYRNKDGTRRQHSEKQMKEKNKREVEERLAEWEKGMKKAQSESDQDQDYQLAKYQKVWDDPMKRWQTNKLIKPLVCKYDGAPNRFGIKPGFRWDGVIRGNGFQNQYIQQQNLRKAEQSREDREYLKNL